MIRNSFQTPLPISMSQEISYYYCYLLHLDVTSDVYVDDPGLGLQCPQTLMKDLNQIDFLVKKK